jgi:hypothetical protein
MRDTLGATSVKTLPPEWRNLLHERLGRGEKSPPWQPLHTTEGKWPQFALTVTNTVRRMQGPRVKNLPPLGACRPKDFSPDVTLFIEETLYKVLKPGEKKRLTDAEGKWPEYPRVLVALATDHQLVIPGMMLPEF